jgi:hypothetical protein
MFQPDPPSRGPHPLQPLASRPEVAQAAASARTAVDRLLRHRILRRRSSDMTAESALRGARASAALAGVDWPLEAVRGLRGAAGDESAALVHGALRVSAEIGALATVWRRAPLQALARLHVLAAADVLPAAELGRPWAGGPRLTALAELASGPAAVPAIVEAAVVHGELLALAPFRWGNGLVARAAQRLILVSRGLDPQSIVAVEVGHAALAEEYAASGLAYRQGSPDDVAAWVTHCARAVEVGAHDALAFAEALSRGALPDVLSPE